MESRFGSRAHRVAGETVEVSCNKLLVFTAKMIAALVSLAPSLAHRLYLQASFCHLFHFISRLPLQLFATIILFHFEIAICVLSQAAQTADALSEEALAYEFLSQSFIVTSFC